MYDSYKVMSGAVGVKKPQEDQKAAALWAMKAAKDRKEEAHDPSSKRKHSGKQQNATGVVGRAPQRSKCCAGQSSKVRGRSVLKLARGLVEARQP